LQDYAEAVRLDPSDKTAASNHQEIALEVERLDALAYQKNCRALIARPRSVRWKR
jgi:hypothetical protein